MSVKDDLLEIVSRVDQEIELPPVSKVYIPEPEQRTDRHTEFGVVLLEDGAAGLYYAWMGDSQAGMTLRYSVDDFIGNSPMELVRYYESDAEDDCSLGLAAINAITQCVFRRAGFKPDTAAHSMGGLDVQTDDHIGMVGYFAPLVRRLQEQGVRATVIEKKEKFHGRDAFIHVANDPELLLPCNKILCTSATLLNNSIDDILQYTGNADQLIVIGPTAGFFPDPLFKRGVSAIGGSEILNAASAIDRLKHDQGLDEDARKYLIPSEAYPGINVLMNQLN